MSAGNPQRNLDQPQLLADVREAFEQLEAAISSGDPERCRPYVGDQVYQLVSGTVSDLAARGHRRVHGMFEIDNADVIDAESAQAPLPDPAGKEEGDRVQVRLHASSSIFELDRQNQVVQGSTDLMSWTQDLTAIPEQTSSGRPHWIIGELGSMSVEGKLVGPAGQPMDQARQDDLEYERRKRDRDDDERGDAIFGSVANFASFNKWGGDNLG